MYYHLLLVHLKKFQAISYFATGDFVIRARSLFLLFPPSEVPVAAPEEPDIVNADDDFIIPDIFPFSEVKGETLATKVINFVCMTSSRRAEVHDIIQLHAVNPCCLLGSTRKFGHHFNTSVKAGDVNLRETQSSGPRTVQTKRYYCRCV